MQRAQFDRRVFAGHDQVGHAFFVAQEQVLGMAAGDGATQFAALFDGKDGRMRHGLVWDAETIEIGKKLGRRGWHAFF